MEIPKLLEKWKELKVEMKKNQSPFQRPVIQKQLEAVAFQLTNSFRAEY